MSIIPVLMSKFISLGQARGISCIAPLITVDDILSRVSEKPVHLGFEVANICNANCVFCGYQYLERQKLVLPMDLFKKGLDEFDALGGESIGFNTVVGDPLVDPHILERIQYTRSKKSIRRIGLYTNGILINRVGAKELISSGINAITISIGGFDHETYLRVFRVDRWDCVYKGILNLLKANEASGNKVKISISLRSDIPIWESLRKPAYRELKRFKFDLEFNIRHFDNWSGRIKQEHLSGTMRLRDLPKKREPCSVLYRAPKILSNGNLTLCGCRDLNGDSELIVGNIAERCILEMWHDPRVENLRNGFYVSKYPAICRDCSMYSDLSFFRREKAASRLIGGKARFFRERHR